MATARKDAMNWLALYLDATRDRAADDCSEAAVKRDADFRNLAFRRAAELSFPRCQFRPGEAVMPGIDAWGIFTARADVHSIADAMLDLDGIAYAAWRRREGAA